MVTGKEASSKSYFMPSDYEFDDTDKEDDNDEISKLDIIPEMNIADLDKTDEEICAWKAYYLNKQLYHNYLLKELNDGEEIRHLEPFIDSLTEIRMIKDNVAKVEKKYGTYYCWVKVTMSTLNEKTYLLAHYSNRKRKQLSSTSAAAPTVASTATSTAASTAASPTAAPIATAPMTADHTPLHATVAHPTTHKTAPAAATIVTHTAAHVDPYANTTSPAWPRQIKYVLELKTKHDKWKLWVSLHPSTLATGGIGLFAERQFEKNTPLGFYIGEKIWEDDKEGRSKPSDDRMDHKIGIQPTKYDLSYLDNNCKMQIIWPQPVEHPHAGKPQSLYMGMHYINNACHTYMDKQIHEQAIKKIIC